MHLKMMKTLKNWMMLMALVLTVGLMSCDEQSEDAMPDPQEQTQDQVDGRRLLSRIDSSTFDTSSIANWQELASGALPQSVLDYLQENYPNAEVLEAFQTDTNQYVVLLDDYKVVIFDENGVFILALDLSGLIDDLDDDDWDDDDYDDDYTEIPLEDLSQTIKDYVATNYPDCEIEEAGSDTETGEIYVALSCDLILVFDADGNFIEEFEDDFDDDDWGDDDWDEVPLDSVPQSIIDYLQANYPNVEVEAVCINPETGDIYVFLENDMVIVFDSTGTFIEALTEDEFEARFGDEWDDDDWGGDDWDDDEWTEIPLDSLPQAVVDYVTANYPNDTMEGAVVDTETGNIYVLLSSEIVLEFDADGNFIEAFDEGEMGDEHCVEVNPEDLPQAIKDYISTNYPDNTVEEAWFNEVDEEFYVELDNDLILVFDKDGNFIEVLED